MELCLALDISYSVYVSANALVRNDDCHTALDVARIKGHTTVVRAIEVIFLWERILCTKIGSI